MKINKKVLIPLFATAMGLSVVGGISGAVAWYQYNSRVSASFAGASVADTGVLQIGHLEKVFDQNGDPVDADSDGHQDEEMVWGRDFYDQVNTNHLIPVTFGELVDDDTDANNVLHNCLPDVAYAYPEAGAGEGYTNWVAAEKGKDYVQFDIYFRSYQANASEEEGFELVARDVFLSDYICESVTGGKVAQDAIRIHLAVEGQDGRLLSLNEYKDDAQNNKEALNLYGNLDLDKNSEADTYHQTLFNQDLGNDHNGDPIQDGDLIWYGNYGEIQETNALDDVKTERADINNRTESMPRQGETGYENKILTTSTSDAVKVTVTIWLEGWELLKTGEDETSHEDIKAAEWNPYFSAGTDIQVGLQFDTGMFRGSDLY